MAASYAGSTSDERYTGSEVGGRRLGFASLANCKEQALEPAALEMESARRMRLYAKVFSAYAALREASMNASR